MRGGPPKLKAEARVAAAAPTSPVVYGPPPPPAPATPSKRARDENNPDDVYARRLGLATGRPDISLPPPLDAEALARDKAARRMEAAIARARRASRAWTTTT